MPGVHVTFTGAAPPVTTGAGKVTGWVPPATPRTVTLAGQAIAGASGVGFIGPSQPPNSNPTTATTPVDVHHLLTRLFPLSRVSQPYPFSPYPFSPFPSSLFPVPLSLVPLYSAPMPRYVRSFSSWNLSSASGSLASSDAMMPARNPAGIETMAGFRNGNTAAL